MAGYLRALAADFDGTLTSDGRRPPDRVLQALAATRSRGIHVLLVTGRILTELREVFPDVSDHVDGIVAENGCVLTVHGRHRTLADPVDPRLADRLAERGVRVRAGEVLLAGRAADRGVVLEEVHRLQLDCQLVFNRSELMILPAGVTKGTGLYEALGDLGLSRHSTVGIGDAENDRALLEVCEVGVAVADAVEALRRHADVVLTRPDGHGVVSFVTGLLAPDAPPVHSRRRRIRLGTAPDGMVAALPSSQFTLLVCGEPGCGKSYLTGLLAERLIAQGYCVLVIDPEGDHPGLAHLRGVHLVSGARLPGPERVVSWFRQRFTSVVLDLSLLPEPARTDYLDRLGRAVADCRRQVGLPHWIVADEGHSSVATLPPRADGAHWGHCLATYRPEWIDPDVLAQVDAVVAMGSGLPARAPVADLVAGVSGAPFAEPAGGLPVGSAHLALRPGLGGGAVAFEVGSRLTDHHRHQHKYVAGRLAPDKAFYFRDEHDQVVSVAVNLHDFRSTLAGCGEPVLAHHLRGGDFSRWLREVFSDRYVSSQIAEIEADVAGGRADLAAARGRIAAVVARSYGVGSG